VCLVQWTLFGDYSLRRFRDQEIQIEHDMNQALCCKDILNIQIIYDFSRLFIQALAPV